MREHAGKHHSRHIYRCGARRASVVESEKFHDASDDASDDPNVSVVARE